MANKLYVAFRGDFKDMEQIKTIAEAEQRSMGAQVRFALREWLEQYAEKRGKIDSEKSKQS